MKKKLTEEEKAVVKDMAKKKGENNKEREREEINYGKAEIVGHEEAQKIGDEIEFSEIHAKNLIEDSFKKEYDLDEQKEEPKQDVEDYKGASRELFNNKDVRIKTELNMKEIKAISKLNFIAQRYKLETIGSFIEDYMSLKISHRRRSRSEFIQGLHAEEKRQRAEQQEGGVSMIDSFLNKFRGGGN